jgi:hypothetical protein
MRTPRQAPVSPRQCEPCPRSTDVADAPPRFNPHRSSHALSRAPKFRKAVLVGSTAQVTPAAKGERGRLVTPSVRKRLSSRAPSALLEPLDNAVPMPRVPSDRVRIDLAIELQRDVFRCERGPLSGPLVTPCSAFPARAISACSMRSTAGDIDTVACRHEAVRASWRSPMHDSLGGPVSSA